MHVRTGASFCYTRDGAAPYEAQEVRAFGLLLCDLVARLAPTSHPAGGPELGGALGAIVGECLCAAPAARPTFAQLAARLARLVSVRGPHSVLVGWVLCCKARRRVAA